MALFITQCPHCNTSFRTRISQLQSADGMVRCGACLKIFVADDNLVPSPDLQTVTAVEVADPTTSVAPQLPFENSMEESLDADGPPDIDDDIITLDLADSVPNRITPSFSEHQPLWELLDEEEEIQGEQATDVGELEAVAAQQATTIESPIDNPIESPIAQSLKPVLYHIHDLSSHDDLSTENITAMHDFEDPLELDWHQPQQRPRNTTGMWAIALVLTVGLAAQFIWYRHESLSQSIAFRPWLERACSIFNCNLPPLVAIDNISSDNLVIRSHTEIANALSVNLVVRNDATFPQPFPALNLRFTSATNELVAARQFTPREYLTPEVMALGIMPSRAPVQITLDILDPGPRATNYEVSFSPTFSATVR